MSVFDDLETGSFIILAEFLLGISYLAGIIEGAEEDLILEMLMGGLSEDVELPEEVSEAVEDFEDDDFDIEVAAEPLGEEDDEVRLHILRLTASLRGVRGAAAADDVIVGRVAEALDIEVELLDEFDALEFSADSIG